MAFVHIDLAGFLVVQFCLSIDQGNFIVRISNQSSNRWRNPPKIGSSKSIVVHHLKRECVEGSVRSCVLSSEGTRHES